ncbi:cell division cycle 20.2, cofactor of APC complex-like [Lotus japonicus]|uniref:cell division cycle 20.2, cofactor of APC complex-like n=1 Tax=Lotus japonicus TaxID=34305 RepID=UPI0025852DB1|nr:cell division cycle 20.2, cofactor of APC complex-like [Lotus japonicus]
MWSLDRDWYTPRSLLSTPTHYHFPGDRFIPNRSLMDLDQAHSLLTNRFKETPHNQRFSESYRQKLDETLNLGSDGKPFRMLVFRGCPKSTRKSIREAEAAALQNRSNQPHSRAMPKKETKILDVPNIRNDYYANIMDWGKNNILAVALGSEIFLWNSLNSNVLQLFEGTDDDCPTSVAWSQDAKLLAAGFMNSELQLWDAETSKPIRMLEGHRKRVATIAWNGDTLTSGSLDNSIINHDVRARRNVTSRVKAHRAEVCGLKWSRRGNMLASGGGDNHIYIWDSSKMSSSSFLHCFKDHRAAVKALAWCPYDSNVLGSGGGTDDRCIKIWNVQKGTCIRSIDTTAQVCGLEWNRHHKEILSGHGFSTSSSHNQLCLWRYPSMTKVGGLGPHASRVLHLSQSPDGLTVVSAGADERLRFWDIFGPPATDTSKISYLDNLLSFKISQLR